MFKFTLIVIITLVAFSQAGINHDKHHKDESSEEICIDCDSSEEKHFHNHQTKPEETSTIKIETQSSLLMTENKPEILISTSSLAETQTAEEKKTEVKTEEIKLHNHGDEKSKERSSEIVESKN